MDLMFVRVFEQLGRNKVKEHDTPHPQPLIQIIQFAKLQNT